MDSITTSEHKVMRPVDWALTLFIVGLPLIGLIMLLIWAFGDEPNIHKKNFAKGSLLLYALVLAFTLIFIMLLGGFAAIANFFN